LKKLHTSKNNFLPSHAFRYKKTKLVALLPTRANFSFYLVHDENGFEEKKRVRYSFAQQRHLAMIQFYFLALNSNIKLGNPEITRMASGNNAESRNLYYKKTFVY